MYKALLFPKTVDFVAPISHNLTILVATERFHYTAGAPSVFYAACVVTVDAFWYKHRRHSAVSAVEGLERTTRTQNVPNHRMDNGFNINDGFLVLLRKIETKTRPQRRDEHGKSWEN